MNDSILMTLLDLIDSGYWNTQEWTDWADNTMQDLNKPPYWVIQLSMAENSNIAISILREKMAEIQYKDELDHKAIVLGYLYLKFKEDKFSLQEFLSKAWQETEAEEDKTDPSNAEIFHLYEKFQEIQKDTILLSSFLDEVNSKFSKNLEIAQSELSKVK